MLLSCYVCLLAKVNKRPVDVSACFAVLQSVCRCVCVRVRIPQNLAQELCGGGTIKAKRLCFSLFVPQCKWFEVGGQWERCIRYPAGSSCQRGGRVKEFPPLSSEGCVVVSAGCHHCIVLVCVLSYCAAQQVSITEGDRTSVLNLSLLTL